MSNCKAVTSAINKYYKNFNVNKSPIDLVVDISKIFQMRKATARVFNEKMDTYITAYEYLVDEDNFNAVMFNEKIGKYIVRDEVKNTTQEESHSDVVNSMLNKINDRTAEFVSLFNGEDYLYTNDYSTIKDKLHLIDFEPADHDDIKEMFILIMDYNNYFGYIVFERNRENHLTEDDIETINALCSVFGSNIAKSDIQAKYEADLLIKNTILDNENVPMLVVEKDTFRVLFVNDLYTSNFRNVQVGQTHEYLKEDVLKHDLTEDLLISDACQCKHQWLRKGLSFKFKSGTDAYMIYFKDNIDYVNQLNAIDSLTQATLLRGFEEHYSKFLVNGVNNYALYTIDIDRFKYINDMFGYDKGDEILVNIAKVIKDTLLQGEMFCRMNEEKFAMFLRYKDEDELNEKIKHLSNQFEDMKNENFADIKITITGGVTLVDKTLPLNTLLDQSTIARKSAKGTHKNNFSYYNAESDAKIKREIQLEERIPYAIANDEFVPYLQPKFDLETQQICGAEALVRWVTDEGMIYPDQFIPLFEKNGFILTLDFIIYNKVMAYIRKCLDNDIPVYPISVNVSRNHIKDGTFMKKFNELLVKYDVPLKYLELEITESVFVEDKKDLIHFVDEIKGNSLKVSIDDFGTAYSSLQNLTEIDIDVLKIDKGFLDNIDTSANVVTKDEILIKNIINLAKELDFNVICEGVETNEQIELLKKVGCEYGQGYVFARPMPIEDYEKRFLS